MPITTLDDQITLGVLLLFFFSPLSLSLLVFWSLPLCRLCLKRLHVTTPTRKSSGCVLLKGDSKSYILLLKGDSKSYILSLKGDSKSYILSLKGDSKSYILLLKGENPALVLHFLALAFALVLFALACLLVGLFGCMGVFYLKNEIEQHQREAA